ncbi:LysR family transcriptional regulator [Loktanella sp. S4079]|uniref:LysR family transcriptional regulator n=1 Tax=Loktanella sp. S4079 TaxID=579483 RepID=UPI0005FA2452|nr:LysR family transcriptional regulator [Loktanella sp. S4079]KJZ20311.1 transcriptional regulator [Loktanella sp. S4079]
MDRFQEMQIFVHVVDVRSFRGAAAALGLAPSTVTDAVKRGEERLRTRLLDRTTRVVSPTPDGLVWYARCKEIIHEVEDAESTFTNSSPEGRVRLDAVGSLARQVLLPALPAFLQQYPKIELILTEGERLVDLIREGVDIALRAGPLEDSGLIRRSLGELSEVTVASREYVSRHGMPTDPNDLNGHQMIGFYSTRTQNVLPLDFVWNGKVVTRQLPCTLTVSGTETLIEAARAGLGIAQLPRYRLQDDLRNGTMIELLNECQPTPSPLAAIYPRDRHLSARVRVVLDWLSSLKFG